MKTLPWEEIKEVLALARMLRVKTKGDRVIGFMKRRLGESMIAIGLWLLFAAGCWAALLDQPICDWWLWRESLWFRQNWPVMLLPFSFCAIGSPLLLLAGTAVCIVRDERREAELSGCKIREPDNDKSLA